MDSNNSTYCPGYIFSFPVSLCGPLYVYVLLWIFPEDLLQFDHHTFFSNKKEQKKKLYISMKLLFSTFCIPSQRTCLQAWLISIFKVRKMLSFFVVNRLRFYWNIEQVRQCFLLVNAAESLPFTRLFGNTSFAVVFPWQNIYRKLF